jgi:AcrR family transcriptional regulator
MLLARGLVAVSMESVAERAGVSKATIYRWWPTKEALALDALYYDWDVTADARITDRFVSDVVTMVVHAVIGVTANGGAKPSR